MTDQLRSEPPVDDQHAAGLAEAIQDLPADQRYKILEALSSAVVSYERTGDPATLAQFARDLRTTVTLQHDPAYLRASAAAPARSSGTGRLVKDIFAAART